MNRSICPVCEKKFSDVLKHIAISHEITDINDLKKVSDDFNNLEHKRREFSAYVDDLKDKIKEGEITHKEFRNLADRWWKEYNSRKRA